MKMENDNSGRKNKVLGRDKICLSASNHYAYTVQRFRRKELYYILIFLFLNFCFNSFFLNIFYSFSYIYKHRHEIKISKI